MRIIDLLKDVMKEDLSKISVDPFLGGSTTVSRFCFEYLNANDFGNFVDLTGETKILRRISRNSEGFYSIGIGTNKIKGWYMSPLKSHTSIDLCDFYDIDQDESYLVLKYGKSILDELEG